MPTARRASPLDFLLLLVLTACGGGSPPGLPAPLEPQDYPVTEVLYSDDRAEIGRERVLIRNERTLQTWWDRATEHANPKPTPPTIDFDSHFAVLVAAGRSNAGDQIAVEAVRSVIERDEDGGQREVWQIVVRSTPDCNPFPGASYPLQIVEIRRVPEGTTFVDEIDQCQL